MSVVLHAQQHALTRTQGVQNNAYGIGVNVPLELLLLQLRGTGMMISVSMPISAHRCVAILLHL